MRFIDLRHLSGPNVFTTSPVSVARLELDELTSKETTDFGGFSDRLTALLPGLADHHCAAGRPGGFLEAMERGTYFGHVTEHVALELSGLAGRPVHLGRTMWAGADGRYDVMMECPIDEPADSGVPAALMGLALQVVEDVLRAAPAQFTAELDEITRTAERERLGISTAAIAAAARDRDIPVRRVGSGSLLRLGHGRSRRLVCAALTSRTPAVGVDIAADKKLAKQLLAAAGIPVPDGIVVGSAEEAARAFDEIGGPVVVKPLGGNQGANITVGVSSASDVAPAYAKASAAGGAVLVEAFLPGTDYRVLVIDGQLAAAAELRPAAVTGDGERTIGQLVAIANTDPRRGDGHSRELTKIKLDADAISHLNALGLDDHSVPPAGQLVALRRNANLSTGGTSRDVTELVHAEVAAMCVRAAAVSGLDICGIDLRLADIGAPLIDPAGHGPAQPGGVLELNACPGLRMHLSPTEGTPRDVAAAVVDSLYPPGVQPRIPIISVTGTNGKTTTVRMIDQVLRQAGLRTGMSCTDGVSVGGKLVYSADASGPRSAEMVLDDPTVEAVVLETARGGIIRRGLGYDRADVAVVTNIAADHLGDDCIDTIEELIHVKALVAEEIRDGGSVVLNADDPATVALADRSAVRRHAPVIRLFSLVPGSPVLERHKQAGGLCYEVIDGQLTETGHGEQRPLLPVSELPGAFDGRARHVVANALAAVAAVPRRRSECQGHPAGARGLCPGGSQPWARKRLPRRQQPGHRRLRPQRGRPGGNRPVHHRGLWRRAGGSGHSARRPQGRPARAVRRGDRRQVRRGRALRGQRQARARPGRDARADRHGSAPGPAGHPLRGRREPGRRPAGRAGDRRRQSGAVPVRETGPRLRRAHRGWRCPLAAARRRWHGRHRKRARHARSLPDEDHRLGGRIAAGQSACGQAVRRGQVAGRGPGRDGSRSAQPAGCGTWRRVGRLRHRVRLRAVRVLTAAHDCTETRHTIPIGSLRSSS